jgi:membrane-associated phospholipid phosphatase
MAPQNTPRKLSRFPRMQHRLTTQPPSRMHDLPFSAVPCGDQQEIYTAPLRRRNVKWDLLFLAATGGMIAGDKHISGALSRDHVDVSQHISDVGMYSMTASVAGLWLSSLKTQDAHARETGFLAAEAFANTAALLGVTQFIAGRERPTEGSGNGRFWQNNALGSSFPSAHSSFTWAMASVVAHEYPKPWVRWLASMAQPLLSR